MPGVGPAFPCDNNGTAQLPPGTQMESPLRHVSLVPFLPDSGLKALGVPVCHPSAQAQSLFAQSLWEKRLKDIRRKCEALVQLPQAHVQLTLLRCCLDARKVNDLLRAAPLEQAVAVQSRIGALLRDTLGLILGAPLSDGQCEQATLPARFGGLGIQDPAATRLPARIAGLVDFVRRAPGVLGLPTDFPHLPSDFVPCLSRARELLGDHQPLVAWLQDSSWVAGADRSHLTQRWWSDCCARRRQALIREKLKGEDAVRFESQTSATCHGVGGCDPGRWAADPYPVKRL